MNHTKTFLSLILTGLIASGCSGSGTKEATLEDYNAAVSQANASIGKAKKVNYEWRDSKKILKKAAKAAKAGDFTKALKLANKAGKQGELAVAQAADQKNAGPL